MKPCSPNLPTSTGQKDKVSPIEATPVSDGGSLETSGAVWTKVKFTFKNWLGRVEVTRETLRRPE
jgi:hypothetical protein